MRLKGMDTFDGNGDSDVLLGRSPRAARLDSRFIHLLVATPVVTLGLAALAAAQASDPPRVVTNYGLTPERLIASTAALAGLAGAVVGGIAVARSLRRIGAGQGRRGAVVALVTGSMGLSVGGMVVATASGGLGTGNGLGGGVVAMVLGLIGMVLGGLVLARFRRIA